MTSQATPDALADHLITPQNSALVIVDFRRNQRQGTVPGVVGIVLTDRLLAA